MHVRIATLFGLWILTAVPSAAAMTSYRADTLNAVGEILGQGRFVVLEPERWDGKRFPLLDHIEIDADLSRGS